ncbi:MAG: RRXRR domain-containing protein [Planktothrix sp.]
MQRVPVISSNNQPLMPTKSSRARRWIKEGKAIGKFNDLGQFYVQLKVEPLDDKIQPIAVGIDPGKLYSGIGVQSANFTLWTGHLELPFKKVRERMDNRRMIRRGRRGRRINRNIPFSQRAHRQVRFSNRRQSKLPPSIRANRQLELRVVKELFKMFPITDIYFEYVRADVDLTSGRKGAKSGKGFSAVMVGQKQMVNWLSQLATVHTIYGWQTSNLRKYLKLEKSKDKSEQTVKSHAVDGITLACYHFLEYKAHFSSNTHGHSWQGNVTITSCPFAVIKRPPISRRQLHLMVPYKGNVRRKYGGTTTEFGLRKGDLVNSPKGIGYVSGQTKKQISVSDANWKRLGQIAFNKITLIRRSNGLIIAC